MINFKSETVKKNSNIDKTMNKYANQYLDKLKEQFMAYKPFNADDALYTGAPVGAALGAVAGGGLGALSGLVSNPGYDAEGRKKSRIKESIKGLLGGGAIGAGVGALGAAALPTIGSGAVDLNSQIEKLRLSQNIPDETTGVGYGAKVIGDKLIDAKGGIAKFLLPKFTNKSLIELAKQQQQMQQ